MNRMTLHFKQVLFAMTVALFVSFLIAIGLFWQSRTLFTVQHEQERFQALRMLSEVSAFLKDEVYKGIRYTDFFSLIISKDPYIDQDVLAHYAHISLQQEPNINGVQFAPQGVVKYVYPYDIHKAAIGHDLLNDPNRQAYINQTIRSGNTSLQGPVQALQGGVYLFNRKAVYYPTESAQKLWGITVISIDFERLMQTFLAYPGTAQYDFALQDISTHETTPFWGKTEIFTQQALTQKIILPNTTWQLAILPKDSWQYHRFSLFDINLFFYIIVALIFLLAFISTQSYLQNWLRSRQDPLTGSLNKGAIIHSIAYMLSQKKPFTILLMDLNGFKYINDSLGHYVGDKVLQKVSQRIATQLRQSDKLSRFGGDEFMAVILDEKISPEPLIKRIKKEINQPMLIEGHELTISIAIGAAKYPEHGHTYVDLYQHADQAMYLDKKAQK